jgi:glycosyltransferase involved in cell wall biosynthesis
MADSTKPYVSIGMPVYNGAKYLRDALESLLSQTFTDFELIISDNGSTDSTPDICRAYAARDARVRYYRYEINRGATWNYNNVAGLARGVYFRWAAHDDMCAPTYLERCVATLDQTPQAVLCFTGTIDIDEHGFEMQHYIDDLQLDAPEPEHRWIAFLQAIHELRVINPAFGLIRLAVLRETKLIGNFVASDETLLAELTLRGTFAVIPEHLFFRRNHSEQSVRANYALAERIVWFDPRMQGRLQMPRWRWLFEYLGALWRVPLGKSARARCCAQMISWCAWNWRGLSKDIAVASVWIARQIIPRRSEPTTSRN